MACGDGGLVARRSRRRHDAGAHQGAARQQTRATNDAEAQTDLQGCEIDTPARPPMRVQASGCKFATEIGSALPVTSCCRSSTRHIRKKGCCTKVTVFRV